MRARPGTVPATGLSGPLGGPGFLPYCYGATSGRPSAGRPLRVLAAVEAGITPESLPRVFEAELDAERRRPGRGGAS